MLTILLLVVAYLLGSIPFGLVIGKLIYKKDIRQFGSGNTVRQMPSELLGPLEASLFSSVIW